MYINEYKTVEIEIDKEEDKNMDRFEEMLKNILNRITEGKSKVILNQADYEHLEYLGDLIDDVLSHVDN